MKKLCKEEIHKRPIDFGELIKARIKSRTKLLHYLEYMSEKHFKNTKAPYMKTHRYDSYIFVNNIDLYMLTHQNEQDYVTNYHFLLDDLTSIIEQR